MQPTEYPSPSKLVGESTVAVRLAKKKKQTERPSLEPVFGLSILSYSDNMAVQHGGLHGRGPATYVDIKGSSKGNKNNSYFQVLIH